MSDPADLPDLVRGLLHTLLDRHEQPGRRTVVRARLSRRDHPAYFSDAEIAPRRETNAALMRLAAAGAVSLRWQKWEEGNWLESLDLVAAQADQIYRLLGRRPRDAQEAELRALLAAERPRPGWHAAFLAWAAAQIDAGRSVAPLAADNLVHSADLLLALSAVADLRAPTLERTLSARTFGDSKRLEGLRSAIARVLREHDMGASAFGGDLWALLRAHELDRVPEYIPVAGPLRLRLEGGQEIDLGPMLPSVALSASMLRAATPTHCAARAVLTVENSTSFSELIAARPPDLLVVYTGGFASPSLVRLLLRLRAAEPELPLAHWGDLDGGGLRILAHLRSQLGPVAPVAMDADTLASYVRQGRPLTPGDRAALADLRQSPALSDCAGLIDALLAAGVKLEQEAIPPAAIIAALAPPA
ncbi:DUF2399 domain-containing protein [Chloroflexales bacterium ZM16-3]|nr:DUF2399 domain-containing protein [Chloroflexales bacterium ZM16-3]